MSPGELAAASSRRRPFVVGALLALAWLAWGCGPRANEGADARPEPDAADRRPDDRGEVHYHDTRLPVGPFVAHEARMDLHVACRLKRDAARAAKQPEPPLCYGEVTDRVVATVRVEHRPGLSMPAFMRTLSARDEGAHFAIEPSGSLYQLMDLRFAPRREGAIRPGEVRILSGNAAVHDRLVEALRRHFPGVEVQIVPFEPPSSAPPSPTPGATTP